MRSKLKVLHLVNGDRFGGAERVQELLLKWLDRDLYEPSCLYLKKGRFSRRLQKEAYLSESNLSYTPLMPGKLFRKALKLDVDIVHSHTVRSNVLGVLLKLFSRAPLVIHAHSWPREELPAGFKSRVNHLLNGLALGAADLVIAVSDDLREKLLSHGISDSKIKVIKNGLDLEEIPDSNFREGRGYLMDQLRNGVLGYDVTIIATTALFREVKGTEDLLEAFAGLIRSDDPPERPQNTYLLLIGDFLTGSFERRTTRKIQELGIEKNVIRLGYRSDVLELLSGVDIFALPSHTEGLPYSLLEAGGLGLPIVATDVGGVDELIRPGETGLLAQPKSPKEFGKKLDKLIRNEGFARRLGQKAKVKVKEEFNAQRLAREVSQTYESLKD